MIAAPSLSHPQLFAPRIADSRGRRPPLPSRRRRLLLLSLPRICAVHTSAAPRPPPIGSPPPPPPTATLYDVLGVAAGATASEIKAAYRRMARACHPDVVKDASADEFMRVHAAYATLSDPEKRADYDRRLAVLGRIRLTPATARGGNYPPFYGYTRRSWETDQCW